VIKKILRSRNLEKFAFGSYSYFERIFWLVVNFFPKSLRKIIYKLVFKSFGKSIFIDEHCYFRYPWKISIGDKVVINRGCEFYPSLRDPNSKIDLAPGVILGPNVILFGAGQNPENPSKIDVSSSISIGQNAYIGGNSTIRYGVHIGDNSVIGAGSVVLTNIPKLTIYAGNPAKKIRGITKKASF
jgi:acetyltransferase-like isoleucine patch superfamily enzyme